MSQKLINPGLYLKEEVIKGCRNYIFVNNFEKGGDLVVWSGRVDKMSWHEMKDTWMYTAGGFQSK